MCRKVRKILALYAAVGSSIARRERIYLSSLYPAYPTLNRIAVRNAITDFGLIDSKEDQLPTMRLTRQVQSALELTRNAISWTAAIRQSPGE